MIVLLIPFVAVAVLGFLASLAIHIGALFGQSYEFLKIEWLFSMLIVVWLPTVIVGWWLARDFKHKDFLKAAFRGCPRWIRWTAYGSFGYAIVNFAIVVPLVSGDSSPALARVFSGHLMAFYAIGIAVLYSAIVVAKHDPARRCANGHPVSPSAAYCEACGAVVVERRYGNSDLGTKP